MSQMMTLCCKPKRKTRIMYLTNLSYFQTESYLTFLIAQGLIERNNQEFKTTPKGKQFLEAYHNLKTLLEDKPKPPTLIL